MISSHQFGAKDETVINTDITAAQLHAHISEQLTTAVILLDVALTVRYFNTACCAAGPWPDVHGGRGCINSSRVSNLKKRPPINFGGLFCFREKKY